jgi:hypothetical protein
MEEKDKYRQRKGLSQVALISYGADHSYTGA